MHYEKKNSDNFSDYSNGCDNNGWQLCSTKKTSQGGPLSMRKETQPKMIEHEYSFRVMYHETDQMGTVHHSYYVKYYETARWELFRSIGLSYHSVEKAGYMLPVVSMKFTFLKPAYYDDRLTVKTTLKAVKGARVWFSYQLYNNDNELINEAETVLAFVNKKTWKPCLPPKFVLDTLNS